MTLGCKGFVQFDHVGLIRPHPVVARTFCVAGDGPIPIHTWCHPSRGHRDYTAPRREPVPCSIRLVGQEHAATLAGGVSGSRLFVYRCEVLDESDALLDPSFLLS